MGTPARSKTNRDLALEVQSKILSAALQDRGWSQSDLADATGLPLYTINRAVRGKVLASEDVAQRMVEVLGVDLAALTQPEKRAALHDWAEEVTWEREQGKVRVRVNALVEPGVETAIKVLVNYEWPICTARLAMMLEALHSPLRRPEPGDPRKTP